MDHERLPGELVEDDEDAIGLAVVGAILDEVIGPDMVRPLRPEPDAGAIVQPEPAPLLLLRWDLQPFALPDALDPFVVHVPARMVQQRRHRPVAVTAILRRQLDDVRRQTIFIRAAPRNLALCRAVLTERAAGAALRYAKRLPHMVDALPATRRAQKFPFAASVRIILSRVRSETARLSRAFSFSSSFRRFN